MHFHLLAGIKLHYRRMTASPLSLKPRTFSLLFRWWEETSESRWAFKINRQSHDLTSTLRGMINRPTQPSSPTSKTPTFYRENEGDKSMTRSDVQSRSREMILQPEIRRTRNTSIQICGSAMTTQKPKPILPSP